MDSQSERKNVYLFTYDLVILNSFVESLYDEDTQFHLYISNYEILNITLRACDIEYDFKSRKQPIYGGSCLDLLLLLLIFQQ
jgi:hypothetical protein